MNEEVKPEGELVVRTLAMPADTNPDGDIFGGWLLSQMDIAGGIFSKQLAKGRTVTIGLNKMEFHEPVFVGDVMCCYCSLVRVGNTSITVKVEAWTIRQYQEGRQKVTEGVFTYVAIDENRKPRPVKK